MNIYPQVILGCQDITRDLERVSSTPLSSTPSGVVFNSQPEIQPLGDALNLDNEFLEQCLNEMGLVTPCLSDSDIPQSNQECTTDILLPMDDPLADQFTDLTSLIDSSLLSSLTLPLVSETLKPTTDPSSSILDLESPSSIVMSSSPLSTSPSTPSDNVVPSCSPSSLERKRKSTSTTESILIPEKKKSQTKYVERRKKNNVASQVSRAKRRKRNCDLFLREKELEEENAQLRVKVEEMTKEAERLKKMLIDQLAH